LKTSLCLTMLSLSIPLLGSFILALLFVYKFVVYPAYISPLSKIPNAHWSAPISPLWILWTRYHCRENRDVHKAHLHHGPVVRLGPNEVHMNDLVSLKTVYAGGFEKGEWFSIFDNYGYVSFPCEYLHSIESYIEYRVCSPRGIPVHTQLENGCSQTPIRSQTSKTRQPWQSRLKSYCMNVCFRYLPQLQALNSQIRV